MAKQSKKPASKSPAKGPSTPQRSRRRAAASSTSPKSDRRGKKKPTPPSSSSEDEESEEDRYDSEESEDLPSPSKKRRSSHLEPKVTCSVVLTIAELLLARRTPAKHCPRERYHINNPEPRILWIIWRNLSAPKETWLP